MARAIASRLLHEPTLRLKRSSGEDDAYLYVNALRELFGLDAPTPRWRSTTRRCARCARRAGASARPVERSERPAQAGNAGQPAGARAGSARRGGAGRGRDRRRELERRRARRQGALRARRRAGGPRRRGGPGGPLGQGPARRASRRAEAGGGARPRGSRDAYVGRGVVARRGTRGGSHRHREPAPALQLLALRPDLEVVELHGNVDTRLRKLSEGEFDGIVLAAAGLRRLAREAEIAFGFGLEELTPAAGRDRSRWRRAARIQPRRSRRRGSQITTPWSS